MKIFILYTITFLSIALFNEVHGACQDSSDCDNGLVCLSTKCSVNPLNTLCFTKMDKSWNSGRLGASVPKCDSNGEFLPVQCTGSECYCVDRAGVKIRNYHGHISDFGSMNCKCARDQNDYFLTGLIGKMFYCNSNGSYNTIQCIGSTCTCVDGNGKMVAGKPVVNIGQIQSLKCD